MARPPPGLLGKAGRASVCVCVGRVVAWRETMGCMCMHAGFESLSGSLSGVSLSGGLEAAVRQGEHCEHPSCRRCAGRGPLCVCGWGAVVVVVA